MEKCALRIMAISYDSIFSFWGSSLVVRVADCGQILLTFCDCILFQQEKRKRAQEELSVMEQEMAEASAQMKAREEDDRAKQTSSVRSVVHRI